jgi:hypothetical protein
MMKRRPILALILTLTMIAATSGCRHNQPGAAPPSHAVVVAATLLDASNTTVTVEDGLIAASHAIDQLQTTDPEYYAKVSPLIKKISAANVAAAKKIKIVKDTGAGDWRADMLAIAGSVNISDLTATGIKNPTSQAIVSAALATLIGVLNTINQNFGTGTGGTK